MLGQRSAASGQPSTPHAFLPVGLSRFTGPCAVPQPGANRRPWRRQGPGRGGPGGSVQGCSKLKHQQRRRLITTLVPKDKTVNKYVGINGKMRREPVRTLCTERALECGAPAPHGGGWSYPFTKRASDRPRLLCPPPSTVRHALCVAMASTVSNLNQYDTCQRLTAARGWVASGAPTTGRPRL